MKFEIKDQFRLNDRPLKILSGAVHYFRLDPTQWHDTLFNLKAMGFNTVETYIPWNVHEPDEGKFDFSGRYDLEKFLGIAEDLGLYVLLRPTPFICAEWEFGGLPAWLLNYDLQLRSSDPEFLKKVQNYYQALMPRLVSHQITHNGSVLMMQVENEYGSYSEDKTYLTEIVKMMRSLGVDVPLFTSDGTWIEALTAGTLIDKDIFVTGNFGSHSIKNFDALEKFHQQHNKKWPLMCMEYWDGWFNRWGEKVVRRDASEMVEDVSNLLQRGSINLYMFRGGTNFGFMNGCSARKNKDLPQVTSYDYDAILNEAGEPTEKFFAMQNMLKQNFPDVQQHIPIFPKINSYPTQLSTGCAGLLDNAEKFEVVKSSYPKSFEKLHHYYGYVLYRTETKNFGHDEKLKVIDANDRVSLYADKKYLTTQTAETIGDEVTINGKDSQIQLDILVENQSRVNYGYKLTAPTQKKGIKGGVIVDHQFQVGWQQYLIPFDETLEKLSYQASPKSTQPTFNRFTMKLEDIHSTYIDCSKYGKGCVVVNGINIGRFWSKGPIHTLYVPGGMLKKDNEIIVFETENVPIEELKFIDHAIIDKM
jgi:beta-galactosidase